MSGIALKVLPQFPAQVTGIAPIVVAKSGLSYTISYNPLVATLAVVQIKQKLVTDATFDMINATIPGAPSSAIRQAWDGGGLTQIGGPLLTHIFGPTGLNLNAGQQSAFLAAAALLLY